MRIGEVFIGGKPLSDPKTKRMIGYCPQVDPLLELMSGYETLWFFGRIRGIPASMLQKRIDKLIVEVGLEFYAHKPCGTYSGGNKRKLSLAVAMIGDPKVLFLDEVCYRCKLVSGYYYFFLKSHPLVWIQKPDVKCGR